MTTRTALDWSRIARETRHAVRSFAEHEGNKMFVVNVAWLAGFIDGKDESYPTLLSAVTPKGICGRLTMSMKRMGWKEWTTTAQKGRKFVVPWKELMRK